MEKLKGIIISIDDYKELVKKEVQVEILRNFIESSKDSYIDKTVLSSIIKGFENGKN